MKKPLRILVDKAGTRLDRFVSQNQPQLSRTFAHKLISEGHITVNGKAAKPGLKLESGDVILISVPPPEPDHLEAEDIPLNIIYEDDDLLIIDKPAGLTVHPAPGNPRHTLANAVLSYFPDLPTSADATRPGIVHRLDKDTSGLIIVAKNRLALNRLADQFKAHTVLKVYIVLVKGKLSPQKGFIEAPIGRDPRNRKRMAVVEKGRDARTEYKVIKYVGNSSLIEVRLETGRTHQIRVHLAAIGYPVVGDVIYGVKSAFIARQFLHAHRLGFKLPSSNEYKEFTSELPPDLEQALSDIA